MDLRAPGSVSPDRPNFEFRLFDIARAAEPHVGMGNPRILGIDVRAADCLLGSHERASLQDTELRGRTAAHGGSSGRRPLPDVPTHSVYAERALAVFKLVHGPGARRLGLVDLPVLEAVAGELVLLLQEDAAPGELALVGPAGRDFPFLGR